jgi:hypothetical protein
MIHSIKFPVFVIVVEFAKYPKRVVSRVGAVMIRLKAFNYFTYFRRDSMQTL